MKNKRTYSVVELEKKDWEGNKYTIIDDLGKESFITFATIQEARAFAEREGKADSGRSV